MAQASIVIANGAGSVVRAAINDALEAVSTIQSGSSAPSPTYPFMQWADTANDLLKQRNAANSAWIIKGTLSAEYGGLPASSIVYDPGSPALIDASNVQDALDALAANPSVSVPVRQTVLSGPIDSAGLAAFGGSTGSTTVTMSGTLIATAANGFSALGSVNRIGSGTNLSWTGLSTNGTMYLYVDVNADGTLTAGSGTLAPTYQWGGTYSTTSGQFTFNIQEMVGKVGNGSAAVQTYRLYVGQVTVSGGVVSAITWYQLMGRYVGPWTATLPSNGSQISANHNVGTKYLNVAFEAENTTTDANYAVGDIVDMTPSYSASATVNAVRRTATAISTVTNASWYIQNATTGAQAAMTLASWKWRFRAQRPW